MSFSFIINVSSCCIQFLFIAQLKMNYNAFCKGSLIKYNNVEQLYRDLFNITKLISNEEHTYYCYCDKVRFCCFKTKKCTLCKFYSLFCTNYVIDKMSADEFLIRNRKNEKNLLRLLNLYWPYFQRIKLFEPSALVFLEKITDGHIVIIEIILICL